MSKIFGGNIPAAFDPAIANPRIKHSLIQEMKKVKSPYGLGIEGMFSCPQSTQKLKLTNIHLIRRNSVSTEGNAIPSARKTIYLKG
jgi:hypothetical protein